MEIGKLNKQQINNLQYMLIEQIDGLISELGIKLDRRGRYLVGACPIHKGDNTSALNLYLDGDKIPGYWQCYTRHCERRHSPTILGFIRGVKGLDFYSTIKFAVNFLQLNSIEELNEDRDFTCPVAIETKKIEREFSIDIVKRLDIPSPYFINRGFSKDLLKIHHVGECKTKNNPMSNRVVVPIYKLNRSKIIGFSGRSIFEKCSKCRSYHNPLGSCHQTAKWFHLHFWPSHTLYNLWFAKKQIWQTKKVILVEGPGDVWKLQQAGIYNCVGLFGMYLKDPQQILLEQLGIKECYVALDNTDEAQECAKDIADKLKFICRTNIVRTEAEDIGSTDETKLKGMFSGNQS